MSLCLLIYFVRNWVKQLQAEYNLNRSSSKNRSNSTIINDTTFKSNAKENNTWPNEAFVAILTIYPLVREDQQNVLNLSITNELGTTFYAVRIKYINGKVLIILSSWLINVFILREHHWCHHSVSPNPLGRVGRVDWRCPFACIPGEEMGLHHWTCLVIL